ncbi:unnamed protein product [marine sediment metagenome]|uniref:Uncharacterized protein n=1 Tax=marine sediment metagenome TaxID=412755 RepID=X1NK11_9ZZZZ
MTVFNHRFTVKRFPEKTKTDKKVRVYPPTGIDGAQAGISLFKWEAHHRKRVD